MHRLLLQPALIFGDARGSIMQLQAYSTEVATVACGDALLEALSSIFYDALNELSDEPFDGYSRAAYVELYVAPEERVYEDELEEVRVAYRPEELPPQPLAGTPKELLHHLVRATLASDEWGHLGGETLLFLLGGVDEAYASLPWPELEQALSEELIAASA